MEKQTDRKNPYTLVVGLGVTGMSVVRYLRHRGHDVVVVDSREKPPGADELKANYPEVTYYFGAFDEIYFNDADKLIVSPGVPISEPVIKQAIRQGVPAVGDIELFALEARAPIVAITGSNGKSTVTTLVGEMAKQAGINVAVGGNLGTPALDLLRDDVELYVLELSSFQLETVHTLKLIAAAVLNISADHLDRYESYEDYVAAKRHIYDDCVNAIVNRDDNEVSKMGQGQQHVTGFTLFEPAAKDFGLCISAGEAWLCKGQQKLIAEAELKLGGRHNTANALAALALGESAGIPLASMLQTLRDFTGLPHRTQWVAEKNGVVWYDDSKGTNVGATIAAIEGMQVKNKLLLIAGGLGKGADFSPLQKAVRDKVRVVVLIGKDAGKIEQAINGVVPVVYAKDMDDAVRLAASQAQSGDCVLLSPACASFDMFSGYAHRGEVFVKAVEAL
ncbi:MAG: UDP-N-acetylmuramoyl-L-alanine--D-glutamate ligase [Gammaproteobacteria bacterium]|nr:MAG: UDP-N-acetylmuramoyl-L-alanine--D-glutamate ligase [Gammaproteobacteria bacterium]